MSSPLQNKTAPFIVSVIARLQSEGYEAYIVGGAIRDFMLGREPKDYDVSTSATPEQVRRVFRDRRCIIIGRRFRLVHLYCGSSIVEISTFRRSPGDAQTRPRRAADAPEHMIFQDNEFGTAEDDAHRRDFTVNALFYDPVNDRILDYTGMGEPDIRAGLVRSIGEPALRFEEDPVRILRALKLVGQYGFRLEEKTGEALMKCMPLIVHASVSRLTLELEKILKNPYGDAILTTFRKYGFLGYFLPALDERFDTPAARYMMSLFAARNEHVRQGKYRASMSLVLALFTLPFVEEYFGGEPGGLWNVVPDMEELFRRQLLAVMHPHAVTRRDNANAVSNLILQTRFRRGEGLERYYGAACYPNARELAALQNEVMWHMDDFETLCPARPEGVPFSSKSSRRRSRRRFRKHGGDAQAKPDGTVRREEDGGESAAPERIGAS